jgi:hypothetical protein
VPGFRYVLWTRASTLTGLLGLAVLWLALRMSVRAGRVDPAATPPNCWVYATQGAARRHQAWVNNSKPAGREPYLVFRMGRQEPEPVPHCLVGDRDPDSGVMELDSFKPVDPAPAPWWALWRRTEFPGQPARGD